jgi:hypothetical protein
LRVGFISVSTAFQRPGAGADFTGDRRAAKGRTPGTEPGASKKQGVAANRGGNRNAGRDAMTIEEMIAAVQRELGVQVENRTAPGTKVTNARGGHSNHNFAIAFDVGVFEGNQYLGESVKYKAGGALGRELGAEGGGNWKTLVDQPHFQLRPAWAADLSERDLLAELRARTAAGRHLLA